MINRKKLPNSNELFKKHFKIEKPIFMYKVLYETNNDKEKNSKLVHIFNCGLEDLEKEIKELSEEEIETEKPYNIIKVVKKILEINKINQQGKGLKILTPNQMLSRLPITLAQLKAGNNSEKLKKWDTQENQNLDNMLKDMGFCLLLESLEINMVKN